MRASERYRSAQAAAGVSPVRHWSRTPIIDAQAFVVSKTSPASGFPSPGEASRSHASDTAAAARTVFAAPRSAGRRTLLWTAPAGLALLCALVALAILAAPDRPVAEPLTRATSLPTEGAAR